MKRQLGKIQYGRYDIRIVRDMEAKETPFRVTASFYVDSDDEVGFKRCTKTILKANTMKECLEHIANF